jgi:hypothetical protein
MIIEACIVYQVEYLAYVPHQIDLADRNNKAEDRQELTLHQFKIIFGEVPGVVSQLDRFVVTWELGVDEGISNDDYGVWEIGVAWAKHGEYVIELLIEKLIALFGYIIGGNYS